MPASLTIFAAKDLVFVAAALALVVIAIRLRHWPRLDVLRWLVTAGLLAVISYALALIGGHLYNDPRPFTSSHVAPLIAHAPDNGFPSDHALLAAALVGFVGLVDLLWTIPFVVLAVLVDWARVGAGIHHLVDVVGASVFVAIGTLVALLLAPLLLAALDPFVPAAWRHVPLLPVRRR